MLPAIKQASSAYTTIPPQSVIFVRRRLLEDGSDGFDVFGLEELGAIDNQDSEQQSRFNLLHEQVRDVSGLEGFLLEGIPDHLQNRSAKRKIHVVVSAKSGTGQAVDFETTILSKLLHEIGLCSSDDAGKTDKILTEGSNTSFYHTEHTTKADSISQLGRSLSKAEDHTIIILSGDGGVVELLNSAEPKDQSSLASPARHQQPTLSVLPLGTGNALFNSLHKKTITSSSSDPDVTTPVSPLLQGLRTLFFGRAAPLPCFRADFSSGAHIIRGVERDADPVTTLYGAIVASYGFHSQLVWESDTPEYRKHGDKRFQMVAGELLKEAHAYKAEVELVSPTTPPSTPAGAGSAEEHTEEGEGEGGEQKQSVVKVIEREKHAYILATMVSNLERTFTISPHSRPLDNKLRLIHFGIGSGPEQGKRIMDVMMQAYNDGKHIGMSWTDDDDDEADEAGRKREYAVGYDEVPGTVKITIQEKYERWRKVCIDGTIVEVPEGGSMTVSRETAGRLRILVDPRALE